MFDTRSISAIWDECIRLRAARALEAAFTRLAELSNCLEDERVPAAVAKAWRTRLEALSIESDEEIALHKAIVDKVAKISRITATGGRYSYEELMQLVTLRTQLDILMTFLRSKGMGDFPDLSVADEELLEIARDNLRPFTQAQAAARKNWGLPIRSTFLG